MCFEQTYLIALSCAMHDIYDSYKNLKQHLMIPGILSTMTAKISQKLKFQKKK